jgi:hypothetical protein
MRCHTDEGARAYIGVVNGTEDPGAILALLYGEAPVSQPSAIRCGTCHDEMNPGSLLGDRAVGLPSVWPSQVKTCMACHQLYKDANQTLNTAYHGSWYTERVITDTHHDEGNEFNPMTLSIQGYVLNTASQHDPSPGNTNDGTCLDCHNPHDNDNTRHREWARSGHGGHILETIDPFVGVASVTQNEAPAWAFRFIDFKDSGHTECQRCHTATGFRNLANDPVAYDADRDGFPDTLNAFVATGTQREMLYCWACHLSNDGTLRNPGIFNGLAPYAEPVGRIDAVPDLGGSNICMSCHSGRMSGTKGIALSADDFSNKSFEDGHYLAAAGVMFRLNGYEFTNSSGVPLNYNDVPYYGHKKIGTAACTAGGNPCPSELLVNGPCVGCHMKASAVGHTLHVVEKDANDVITAINANAEICSNCHAGPYALSTVILNEESHGFHNVLEALADLLNSAGFTPSGYPASFDYPYFTQTNWKAVYAVEDPSGHNNMGAAFNYSMLHHEPGAYAHNSVYAKRLVFDSLDWLDNGMMDGFIDLSVDFSGLGHDYTEASVWLIGGGAGAISNIPRP